MGDDGLIDPGGPFIATLLFDIGQGEHWELRCGRWFVTTRRRAKENEVPQPWPVNRVQLTQLGIVDASIGGVDHHPGPVADFVGQSNADDLANERRFARAALE